MLDQTYSEEQFEWLCRSACTGYPYSEGGDQAAAEMSMLWLISFKVCALLEVPLLTEAREGSTQAQAYRRSLRAWGVALGGAGLKADEVAQRCVNERLGRPADAPPLNP